MKGTRKKTPKNKETQSNKIKREKSKGVTQLIGKE